MTRLTTVVTVYNAHSLGKFDSVVKTDDFDEILNQVNSEINSCYKRIDDLMFNLSTAHSEINSLELELQQAIDIIEECGVDYDEIVKARDMEE